MLSRRSILFGLIAAPVVVRAGLIMPVKALPIVGNNPKYRYQYGLPGVPLPKMEFYHTFSNGLGHTYVANGENDHLRLAGVDVAAYRRDLDTLIAQMGESFDVSVHPPLP